MNVPANTPLGSPESITGKVMVLFSPSPHSFYRAKEYDDVEKAKEWCESWAAVSPQKNYARLVGCDAIKWHDFTAGKESFDISRNKGHKYMVLWGPMEGYYQMREFEQFDDAVQYASATRIRLQEMQASLQMGLPENVQVFAFTLTEEWNPANKPAM